MTRRILALVVALVASIAGHLMVFTAGVDLMQRSQQFMDAPANPVSVLGMLLGLLLVGLAALTVAVSSTGVIVLGALHILYGLLTVLLPISMSSRPPTFELTLLLRNLNTGMGDGMLFAFTLGTGLLTGVVLLVAGLVARGRTMHGNAVAIIVSIAVSVLGFLGVFVGITGGSFVYRSMLVMLSGEVHLGGVLLLLLGAVLLAAAVVTVRWSSAGVILLGVVVVLAGVLWSLLSAQLFGLIGAVSRDLSNALVYAGPSGLLALVGIALIGSGVGASIRARRASRMPQPMYAPAPAVAPVPVADPGVV